MFRRSEFHRKKGVIVSIGNLGENGNYTFDIQFYVSIKNDKDSMHFEISDSSGLATTGLTGIIGHAILPKNYKILGNGDITIGDRIIKNAKVLEIEHKICHQIAPDDVEKFLGHSVENFLLDAKFALFKPQWLAAEKTADKIQNEKLWGPK